MEAVLIFGEKLKKKEGICVSDSDDFVMIISGTLVGDYCSGDPENVLMWVELRVIIRMSMTRKWIRNYSLGNWLFAIDLTSFRLRLLDV
jgi:hypothetical protein